MSILSLCDDEIFSLFQNSPLETINRLCRTHPRISQICKESRFRKLMEGKVVDRLIERYGTKENALIESSEQVNLADVDILIRYGVDPSAQRNEAILRSSRYGHLEIVERLLQDSRVNPGDNRNSAIINASLFGYIKVVDRLLRDPRVDPTVDRNLAIVYASERGHLEVVNRLLNWRPLSAEDDRRVDPTDSYNNAICSASGNGHLEIVNRLLDWRAFGPRSAVEDSSVPYHRAFILACQNGHINVMNRLLEDFRVGPFLRNNTGNILYNAILWVTFSGQLESLKRLLELGINLDLSHLEDAIKRAKQSNHIEIVNLLSQYYDHITSRKSNQ